jgi:hypothetical protein
MGSDGCLNHRYYKIFISHSAHRKKKYHEEPCRSKCHQPLKVNSLGSMFKESTNGHGGGTNI